MKLQKNAIIVYDSNYNGYIDIDNRKYFKKYNITVGRCHGLDNNSYGIPTKDENLNVLPLERIAKYVENFVWDATNYPDLTFYVTAIGTGLAGYQVNDIAPLFKTALTVNNIYLPEEFITWLNLEVQKG